MLRQLKDLASTTGHANSNLSWAVKTGLIPAPDIVGKKRKYYSGAQFQKAVNALTHRVDENTALTKTEICKSANITLHIFTALQRQGLVPEPIGYRGKREVWAVSALEQIKRAIAKRRIGREKAPAGYYTQTSAARKLGVPRITWQVWVSSGAIAKATHFIEGHQWPYYSESDLEAIRKTKAEYFESRTNT